MTIKETMQPSGFQTIAVEADPHRSVLITDVLIQTRMSHLVRYLKPELTALQKPPIFLWLAKGAEHTSRDLQFHLGVGHVSQPEFRPIKYSLYEGTESQGVPVLSDNERYPFPDVDGRDVYIVDDVLDTLATASQCIKDVTDRGGRVVGGIFLTEKPESSPWRPQIRVAEWPQDIKKWSLFSVPDLWLEGHGMDTDEEGRDNPDIIVRWDLDKEKHQFYLDQLENTAPISHLKKK